MGSGHPAGAVPGGRSGGQRRPADGRGSPRARLFAAATSQDSSPMFLVLPLE